MSIGPRIIEINLLQALIWNLKVKFMAVVIGQGNAVSPVSNWFTSFFALHQFDQQFIIYNYLKSDFEKKSMWISWARSKLHSSPGIQPMHFLFVMRKLDKLSVRYGYYYYYYHHHHHHHHHHYYHYYYHHYIIITIPIIIIIIIIIVIIVIIIIIIFFGEGLYIMANCI